MEEDDEYNMEHTKRGRALIFNHYKFKDRRKKRNGTKYDVDKLLEVLDTLGFQILVYQDLTYIEILKTIKEVSRDDHKDNDCLLVVVLTHGHQGDTLMAYDQLYSFSAIWLPFTPENCAELAGKPKIFIIQACKGKEEQKVVSLRPRADTDSDSHPQSSAETRLVFSNPDFLIAYSTMEGFTSFRQRGSWFVQSLCSELLVHAPHLDLVKILTRTCRCVATLYETTALVPVQVVGPDGSGYKQTTRQMPSFISTLTKDLHLKPKNVVGHHPSPDSSSTNPAVEIDVKHNICSSQ